MTQKMFVECCVLSGCDYLPSISKMGIKTAAKKMQIYHSGKAVLSSLKLEGKWEIPDNYEENFEKVCLIFYQQRIFDPKTKTIHGIYDNGYSNFIETNITNDEAIGIAYGRLNPKTHEPFSEDNEYQSESDSHKSLNTTLYTVKISKSVLQDFKPHVNSYIPIKPKKNTPLHQLQNINSNSISQKKYTPTSIRKLQFKL